MNGAAHESTTLECLGGGVVLDVPAGRVVALELVRLRLTRPDGAPAEGARAAVVAHTAGPPRAGVTLALVSIMPGMGAAFAEAAAIPGPLAGPATVTCETDADPTWTCRAVVRARWHDDDAGPPCHS